MKHRIAEWPEIDERDSLGGEGGEERALEAE